MVHVIINTIRKQPCLKIIKIRLAFYGWLLYFTDIIRQNHERDIFLSFCRIFVGRAYSLCDVVQVNALRPNGTQQWHVCMSLFRIVCYHLFITETMYLFIVTAFNGVLLMLLFLNIIYYLMLYVRGLLYCQDHFCCTVWTIF